MLVESNGYLEEYYQKCKTGEILIGQTLMTLLKKLILEMDDIRYLYDTAEADKRMHFMENCVKLTKSPFYGKQMQLMLWQKAFISAFYGFKMADTKFDRFKRGLLLIGRKNGKSETTSGLGVTELVLAQEGSDIVVSSNDDSQASIVYDAIDTMRLMIDPKQQDTWRNQRWIRNKVTDTKIFKLSDRTRNKEGRNIDFAIIDEVHEMSTNVIVKSIEQSQSLKDNPKLLLITTEGFVNDGFLDEEMKKARAVISGEDDGLSAERYLPWLYEQDSEEEVWQNRASWVKSNPTLGVIKKWEYLDEQIDVAKRSKADRMFTLSKDFNFKMNNAQAWLLREDYSYPTERFDLEDFRGSLCLGAVDLSATTDLSNAKILLMKPYDKTKYVLSHYWIPESKLRDSDDREAGAKYAEWAKEGLLTICEGNEIQLTDIADWFYQQYKDYELRLYKCGYDQRYAKTFLDRMDEYGFDCEMIYQNRFVMSSPMKLVEADLKDQLINYNQNAIDRWCLGNAAMDMDNLGNVMCVKVNNQKSRRIDGAVNFVILWEVYRRYRSDFQSQFKSK